MKVLATLPRLSRLVPSAETTVTAGLIAFLIAIEVAGGHATTEFHDTLAGLALAAAGMFVITYHRTRPLWWVERVQDWLARGSIHAGDLKDHLGIDFRAEPPLPRKLPRGVWIAFGVLAACTALAFAAWAIYPGGWREFGSRISYVVYILGLMALWMGLFVCVGIGVIVPTMMLDYRLRAGAGEPAPSGPPDAVMMAGYFLLVILVACVAPPIYAASVCLAGVLFGVWGWIRKPADEVAVLWRTDAGQPIYAVPLRRLVPLLFALGSLLFACVIAWACGGRLLIAPTFESSMPLTNLLGTVVAWLAPGLALVTLFQWLEFRGIDPVRQSPPVIHVAHSAAWGPIRRWGFRIATGKRSRDHVGLKIVGERESEALEFQPSWPLRVSLKDLDGTLVKERVARRDELQLRRQFLTGLAKLLGEAKAQAPHRGGGFLIAPQYWFITGILWADPEQGPDAGEETLRPLGRGYRQSLPPRARQYMSRILRDLQVDCIYLEDGVGAKRLTKVLRALLELHDIHGNRRRAEDHHFMGLPKIKVVIHSYEPGNEFTLEGYPEPKFDEVSRSRVLHVFKDRGDSEETQDAPFDFSWEPAPFALV